jgi:hypothetical protein
VLKGNPSDLRPAPQALLDLIYREDLALEKGLDAYDDSPENIVSTRESLKAYPAAVAGQNGNDTTYRAACICRENGVSSEVAFDLMCEYNERCDPPWDPQELMKIVGNAYKYGQNAIGSKNPKNDFGPASEEYSEDHPKLLPMLKAMSLEEFLRLEISPREDILTPIIQTQCLVMIYAKRGAGKTHFALGIAYAIASGGSFLKWQADKPRRVLYLDGEMPANTMQDRLGIIQREAKKTPPVGYFKIINADLNLHTAMPDLSSADGRRMVEPFVDNIDVIVVDNISTLSRTGKENEAESWVPIQQWALEMRRKGKTVIFVHHAGKSGEQRGTSKREDILDLVLKLAQPKDYKPDDGARFEIHFEKARAIMGDDTKPFEAMIFNGEWTYREIENVRLQKIIALQEEGLSFKEIGEEVGVSKSTAQRLFCQYEKQKKSE